MVPSFHLTTVSRRAFLVSKFGTTCHLLSHLIVSGSSVTVVSIHFRYAIYILISLFNSISPVVEDLAIVCFLDPFKNIYADDDADDDDDDDDDDD